MKKYLLIIGLILIGVNSCSFPIYEMNAPCKLSKSDFMTSVTSLLLKEGFEIQQGDANLGFIKAKIKDSHKSNQYWLINYNQSNVYATFKIAFSGGEGDAICQNEDKLHYDIYNNTYWNIKKGLEELCGNKLIITEKKQN